MADLALNQIEVGERLRIARTSASLTQEEAASKLAMARTTMVAIERGERSVRPEELYALAELYGTTVNTLLRGPSVHVDLVGQFRWGRGAKDEKLAKDAVAVLHRLATAYVELETRLDRPLVRNYPPERPLARRGLQQQAEDLAVEVRSRVGVGLGPIPDVVAFLELEVGVRVFVHPLDSKIAGVFAYHDQIGACILVNAKHPASRRAWTLAHEFAHLLTRRRVTSVLALDDRGPKSPFEQFADYFAPAFLMPGVAVRRAFAELGGGEGRFTTRHLILLHHRFRVSLEAMTRRLEDLGLLKAGTFESLRERGLDADTVRSVLGVSTDDEAPASPPPRFALLAADAYHRDMLTEGQVAEMLMLRRVDVRRLLDALGDDADLTEERT
jgi:Zn-dependent peptidase ImmA (M78 family)/transcriptional regulator with XRE-family HTH domain